MKQVETFKTSKPLTEAEGAKLAEIIEGKPFRFEWLQKSNKKEIESIEDILLKGVNRLAGEDRDKFLENVDELLTEETRYEVWDVNHNCIIQAMHHLSNHGHLPSVTLISRLTGLSRPTIYKHLKTYMESEQFKVHQSQLQALRWNVMGKVYEKAAYDGDMKAARVFLEFTEPTTTVQNQQNNFIQINGVSISKERLHQLPQEQQRQITDCLQLLVGS
jgi:hypothetical protein